MIQSIAELVTFLTRFHRHWLVDPRLDPAQLPTDLPNGLATVYRELGALAEIEPGPDNDWRAPLATQDRLIAASRLTRVDGMMEFAWENQGNWSARCPVGLPDPPVYCNAVDLWETVQRGFVVVCQSLNHFLTTLCLQEAVMCCSNLMAVQTDLPTSQVLSIPLQPLWLNGYYVAEEPDHQFFVSEDRDVLVMDWNDVWVGSSTHKVADLVAAGIKAQVLR
ncbi:MAG: hypothetical protein ACYC3X_24110 [Pirellulaceae bacterium]